MRTFSILMELYALGGTGLGRVWLQHGALVELSWALEGTRQCAIPLACVSNKDKGGPSRGNVESLLGRGEY